METKCEKILKDLNYLRKSYCTRSDVKHSYHFFTTTVSVEPRDERECRRVLRQMESLGEKCLEAHEKKYGSSTM